VAYQRATFGEFDLAKVVSVDLRTNRVVRQWRTPACGQVTDFVLGPRGSLAWIDEIEPCDLDPHPIRYEVQRDDRAGQTLPDSGPAIDLGSLALSGATVYWTSTSRAPLCPLPLTGTASAATPGTLNPRRCNQQSDPIGPVGPGFSIPLPVQGVSGLLPHWVDGRQ
jgi:hypothetical protein